MSQPSLISASEIVNGGVIRTAFGSKSNQNKIKSRNTLENLCFLIDIQYYFKTILLLTKLSY